jgi:ABC-type Fe3+-siderophore transport system permease subunit
VPIIAFGGAAGSSALVYRLSLVRGRIDPYTQVLVGVIFNTFTAALILLISAIVELSAHALDRVLVDGRHRDPPVSGTARRRAGGRGRRAVLIHEAPALNLLALGDEGAEMLGVNLSRCRRRVFGRRRSSSAPSCP